MILLLVVAILGVLVGAAVGFWAGVRQTWRSLPSILANMTPEGLTNLARSARELREQQPPDQG